MFEADRNDVPVPIDPLDPRPFYEQLAQILRDAIAAGVYQPRAQLPSEKALEDEHGVSRGTVRHAVRVLEAEGLIVVIQGRGSFVAPKT